MENVLKLPNIAFTRMSLNSYGIHQRVVVGETSITGVYLCWWMRRADSKTYDKGVGTGSGSETKVEVKEVKVKEKVKKSKLGLNGAYLEANTCFKVES